MNKISLLLGWLCVVWDKLSKKLFGNEMVVRCEARECQKAEVLKLEETACSFSGAKSLTEPFTNAGFTNEVVD